MFKSKHFKFDSGPATFWGTCLFSVFIKIITMGFGYPWALCLKQKWIAKHTIIDGRRCKFNAGGGLLIGLWIKWFLLMLLTVGIYYFWVGPNLRKWIIEHTDFIEDKS
jgi:uncharacterized membrane protein YjgN (DUF898 family)